VTSNAGWEEVSTGMIERGTVPLNGLQFNYLAGGPTAGKPVILLHGFPQFADVWTPLLDKLGALGFRAVALEQRGYSPNARPVEVEEYALPKLNADVLALVDHLAWPQFHLIGHDWGGFLAWALAAKHPGRVQSLTVLSTPHVNAFLEAVACDPDQKARSQYIQWFKMPGNVAEAVFLKDDGSRLRGVYQGKVPDEQVSRNLQRLLEPGALTATLNWYRALDLDTRIGHVCVPTLYVWGDEDMALGRAAAEATERYVSGPYRFEALPGYSHWLLDEAREQLSNLIVNHLTGSQCQPA
jgi:pimeloyl-ACP methyl ester carboxylesterase